jgi:hypothetical protein
LGEVEPDLLAQSEKEMVLVKIPGRLSLVPHSADVDDKAPVGFEDSLELVGDGKKPRDVLVDLHRTIGLLFAEGQGERG